jgi:hypothetical protein
VTIGGKDAAIWIAEKVGGGIIGAAVGKGFNEIMAQLGLGDRTSQQLEQMRQQLDAIQGQLHELQNTMNVALEEIEKAHYSTLAQSVIALRNTLVGGGHGGAQGAFLEALHYAGQPDKKATVDLLIKKVEQAVDQPTTGLESTASTVPDAIVPSLLLPKTMYQTLSNVTTGANTKVLTWRQSADIDQVFQYLLYLQALQFNLVVQVKTAQGSSVDQIYQNVVAPFLGERAAFQAFLDGRTASPTEGQLHSELAFELSRVPPGAMVDTKSAMEWSTDVPGGTRSLTLNRAGPGVPVCRDYTEAEKLACVTDPHYSVGPTQPTWKPARFPQSPAQKLADDLAQRGNGAAASWNLPTTGQLASLFSGWTPADSSAKSWLERRSGANPMSCKPITAGMDTAVKDPESCLWPAGQLWPVVETQLFYSITIPSRHTFAYGWRFQFFNIDKGSTQTCDLGTESLQWYGEYSTPVPRPSASCSGSMIMVRYPGPTDRYYFAL